MRESTVVYFEKGGPENTDKTLELAAKRAAELRIRYVVVATGGDTGLRAAKAFAGTGATVIGVTLHAGIWARYGAPDWNKIEEARKLGVKFLTATHTLSGNVEGAIREKFGGVPPVELIAETYYTFSQGTKVAVEIALAAADAGLIGMDERIIAVAGSSSGADTALVIRPAYTTNFFDLRIEEIICKPL